MKRLRVFLGHDTRELEALRVARSSLERRCSVPVWVDDLSESWLRSIGLYKRTFTREGNVRIDDIDGKPFSTDFAFTRFLVPALMGYQGWALFADCDFLFRADVNEVFRQADEKFAVMCVKHDYTPTDTTKMDGQVQSAYPRKNWSSFMLFNCGHPSNRGLTVEAVNNEPGSWLHRFSWLRDEEIGGLPHAWNWLEGHSSPAIDPKAVHFTRGGPWMEDWQNVPFADEYRNELAIATRPNVGEWPDYKAVACAR